MPPYQQNTYAQNTYAQNQPYGSQPPSAPAGGAGGGLSANMGGQVQYAPNSPILGQTPSTPAPAGYTYDPVQNRYVQSTGSAADRAAMEKRAVDMQNTLFQQEQQAFARMQQPLSGLSSAGSGGYGGAAMPQMPQFPSLQGIPPASQFMPQAASQTQQLQFPDMQPAQQAAFNIAKNQQGNITASALAGLQSSLGGRGLLGGGYEGKGTTDIVQQGAQALGDLTGQQAITQANQALDIAKTGYQGGIAQRGQDIGAQQTAQAQALQAQQNQAQQALQAYTAQIQPAEDLYGKQLGAYEATRGQDITARGQDIQAQLEQERLRQQALQGLSSSFSTSFNPMFY